MRPPELDSAPCETQKQNKNLALPFKGQNFLRYNPITMYITFPRYYFIYFLDDIYCFYEIIGIFNDNIETGS
jgi:hypothetical protein